MKENLIIFLILLPISGIFISVTLFQCISMSNIFFPRRYEFKNIHNIFYSNFYKVLNLIIFTSIFFISLLLWTFFKKNLEIPYEFFYNIEILNEYNISLAFGVDGFNLFLLILTTFIFPLCLLYNWYMDINLMDTLNLYLLNLFLILAFLTLDLFIFFIFFEAVLIPMFILIGSRGTRSRKIKAAFFFFLYTLLGSIFMFFAIIIMYFEIGTSNMLILKYYCFDEATQLILWLFFFISFSVKVPIFPFHLWLAEAHVEAPTVGSVILASLLLKLGGYGFIRISLSFFPYASLYFSPLIYTLCIISIWYATFVTIRQIDLKKIIAYSSIVHMNFIILGIFSFTMLGLQGSILLMLSHGLISSALFFLVGMLYDRTKTRLLKYYGGLAFVMPIFAFFFAFFSFANISFPGTMSFIGELYVMLGLFICNPAIMFISSAGIMVSSAYAIWLMNRLIFSNFKTLFIKKFVDLSKREFFILLPLFFLTLVFGVHPNLILETLFIPSYSLLLIYS